MKHQIKFYPVDNGDCTLVKLENGKTVVIDCQIREDPSDQTLFGVKDDLLKELETDAEGRPYVDLFISTHPHKDHCLGFGNNFYVGHPENYDDEKNKGQIVIGELWITPCGLKNNLDSSAEDIRREAKRRRDLYDRDSKFRGSDGNSLRIIGYDEDKEFDKRYCYVPGETVSQVHGSSLDYLEIFIHAPFKEDVSTSKKEEGRKNDASIVLQLAFRAYKYSDEPVARVLMGGDAEYEIWQHILENNQDEDRLKWDILLAPHHCSWTFFNDSGNKEEIQPSSEEILNLQLKRAHIVASSKEIKDDEDNPPCFEAKKQYIKHLEGGADNFLNTAVFRKRGDVPQPIIFTIDQFGKSLKDDGKAKSVFYIPTPAPRAG